MLYFQNHYHLPYVSTQGIRANQKRHRERTEESQEERRFYGLHWFETNDYSPAPKKVS